MKTIENQVWKNYRSVAHFWAAFLNLNDRQFFPCQTTTFKVFLQMAEAYRRAGENTLVYKSGAVLNSLESFSLPKSMNLPELKLRVDPDDAAPAEAPPTRDQINPAMLQIEDSINDASENLWECHEAQTGAELAFQKWTKRNPFSINARAERHTERKIAVMQKLQLGPAKKAYRDAHAKLKEAVTALASIKATNMEEVLFKTEIAFCRDLNGGLSKSVVADLLRIHRPGLQLG